MKTSSALPPMSPGKRHPKFSADLLPRQGHVHHTVVFDLADTKAVVSAAAEILKCARHVDVLINNAGISYRGAIADTVVEVDRKVMETNYFGPVALTKGEPEPLLTWRVRCSLGGRG